MYTLAGETQCKQIALFRQTLSTTVYMYRAVQKKTMNTQCELGYYVVQTRIVQLHMYRVVQDDGCTDWKTEGSCSHRNIYTAVFFTLHSVLLILTSVLSWVLLRNFRIKVNRGHQGCRRTLARSPEAAKRATGRVKTKNH